jgi:hypothetical protein
LNKETAGYFKMIEKQVHHINVTTTNITTWSGTAVWGTALHEGRSWVRFLMASEFFITQSFQLHCDPGVDSASNNTEYQVHFLGG